MFKGAKPFPGRLVIRNPSHSSSGEYVEAPPLRPCQVECMEACGKGARIIEMACGTGKTRVIKELLSTVSGRASRPAFGEHFPTLNFNTKSLSEPFSAGVAHRS